MLYYQQTSNYNWQIKDGFCLVSIGFYVSWIQNLYYTTKKKFEIQVQVPSKPFDFETFYYRT